MAWGAWSVVMISLGMNLSVYYCLTMRALYPKPVLLPSLLRLAREQGRPEAQRLRETGGPAPYR